MATTTQTSGSNTIDGLRGLLGGQRMREALAAVLPRHMTQERMIRIALTACGRSPKLLVCTPHSILQAFMDAAQLGLEPGGPLAEGHLVPFKNKETGKLECKFIPGYQGLLEVARRSGRIGVVKAVIVRTGDKFRRREHRNPPFVHEPSIEDDPGDVRGVYAVAWPVEGDRPWFEYMRKGEVERIRQRSRWRDEGPWVTDWEEMAKKTVLRRLYKLLPRSVEMARAVELDEPEQPELEPGPDGDGRSLAPAEPEPELEAQHPGGRTAEVRERLRQRHQEPPRSEVPDDIGEPSRTPAAKVAEQAEFVLRASREPGEEG